MGQQEYITRVAGAPVARACEVIESTRMLLNGKNRWTKSKLTTRGGGAFCLHGAITRVAHGQGEVPNRTGYVSGQEYAQPKYRNAAAFIVTAILRYTYNDPKQRWHGIPDQALAEHRLNNKAVEAGGLPGFFDSIYHFNDSPNTEHQDIKNVLKIARDLCYQQANLVEDNGGQGF